ncbi:MAG: YdbH domain-containing protein [Thermodesulfobacteriota bacterium]
MRYFSIFLSLLAVGLALLFFYRTPLTEKIIINRLQAMGGEDVQLTLSEIGSERSLVSFFSATFSDDAPLESIELHDLVLSYNLPGLFKGEIIKVEIENLEIIAGQQEKESTSPPSKRAILPFLPQEIVIHQLGLSVPELVKELSLQLSAVKHDTALIDIDLSFDGKGISPGQWQMESAEGELFLQTDLKSFLRFQEKSHVEVEELSGSSATLKKGHLQLSGKLQKHPDSGWQSGNMRIFLASQGVTVGDMELQISPLGIQVKEGSRPSQMLALIHTDELLLQKKEKTIALEELQLDLRTDREKLQLDLLFSHGGLPARFSAKLNHNLEQGQGAAEFHTSPALELNRVEPQLLGQLMGQAQAPIALSGGLAACRVKLQWDNNRLVSGEADLQVENGAGTYNEVRFQGLNVEQQFRFFPEIRSLSRGSLSLDELNAGLVVNNIELRNKFLPASKGRLPSLHIDSLQAEILGATLSSRESKIDPTKKTLDLPIEFHNIDLARLVSLKKFDGLRVSGVVDGNIHLEYRDQQFSVSNGEFLSRAPGGTISYLPPGGAASMSRLPPVAVKALEEFQFSTLTATPRYSPDGTLTFTVRMEGISPPLNTSRPVHLNLNVEQNLLSLLQSLRYSKNLTDDLEQGLQGGRRKK